MNVRRAVAPPTRQRYQLLLLFCPVISTRNMLYASVVSGTDQVCA
jgi:hypothetical protein